MAHIEGYLFQNLSINKFTREYLKVYINCVHIKSVNQTFGWMKWRYWLPTAWDDSGRQFKITLFRKIKHILFIHVFPLVRNQDLVQKGKQLTSSEEIFVSQHTSVQLVEWFLASEIWCQASNQRKQITQVNPTFQIYYYYQLLIIYKCICYCPWCADRSTFLYF